MKRLLLVALALPHATRAFGTFEFPSLFGMAPPKTNNVLETKSQLLKAVSFTSNGKNASPDTQRNVLELVRTLETTSPPSSSLLSDPEQAKALDGVWYLQYTSPSVVGDQDQFPDSWKPEFASEGISNIETRQYQAKGTVSAAGITVDTSNRVVTQCLDVTNSVVTNEVGLDWGRVCVAGPFRPSEMVPNRAIVAFNRASITVGKSLTLELGFLFDILAAFRGSKDTGWLETTYIDEDMRIGRGNKGTMFVLTRDVNAVQP